MYSSCTDIYAINTNLGVLENWRINRLSEVTLPDTVVEIGDDAFKNCQNMTAINGLSDNLKYIGVSAFEGTSSKSARQWSGRRAHISSRC